MNLKAAEVAMELNRALFGPSARRRSRPHSATDAPDPSRALVTFREILRDRSSGAPNLIDRGSIVMQPLEHWPERTIELQRGSIDLKRDD